MKGYFTSLSRARTNKLLVLTLHIANDKEMNEFNLFSPEEKIDFFEIKKGMLVKTVGAHN
jgi:hypothetical protein